MTENREYDEHPELLLAGADRPRPLPPALRARLQDAVVDASASKTEGSHDDARPLSDEVRGRLENSLRLGGSARTVPVRKWRGILGSAGAAAAIIVAAALVVPGLVHGLHNRPASNQAAGRVPTQLREVHPNGGRGANPAPLAPVVQPHGARSSTPAGVAPSTATPNATNRPKLPKKAGATKARPTKTGPARAGPTRAVPPKTGPTKTRPATRLGHSSPLVAGRANPTTVNKIVPRRGPAGGGSWVVVDGRGLSSARAVYFGTVRAPRLTVVSSTEVKALAPAHSPGTVNVTVVGSGPASATSAADRYTFNRLQFGPGPVVPPTSAS